MYKLNKHREWQTLENRHLCGPHVQRQIKFQEISSGILYSH